MIKSSSTDYSKVFDGLLNVTVNMSDYAASNDRMVSSQ
jgi:hypothetical protein